MALKNLWNRLTGRAPATETPAETHHGGLPEPFEPPPPDAAGIDVTHIEFNLTYSKDSYRNRPRGFYLSVQPVEVESQFVRMIPMQGVRGFVSPSPVVRLSKAARKAAHANVGVETLTAYLEQVG